MQTQEKSDREWYEELVADSDYTLANNILKAIEKRDWEEAKTLAQKMIEECTIERKLELFGYLKKLMKCVILWTQALPDERQGEWASAISDCRWNIGFLRVEQPTFDDAYIQEELDDLFDHVKELIMNTDLTPFRIRKPTWEELFINNHSWFND
jgi:hypothetical protein